MNKFIQKSKEELVGFLLASPIFSFYVYVYLNGILMWDPILKPTSPSLGNPGILEAFISGFAPTVFLVVAPLFDSKYSFMYGFVLITFLPVSLFACTSRLRIIQCMGIIILILNPIFVCKIAGIFHPVTIIISYVAPFIVLFFAIAMLGLQVLNKIKEVLGVQVAK